MPVELSNQDEWSRQALAEVFALREHFSYLGDADLSPARIAAEHNISVRYLHLLFAQQGLTVRTWLVRERLEGAPGPWPRAPATGRPSRPSDGCGGFPTPAISPGGSGLPTA
jgi:hypothetical protein